MQADRNLFGHMILVAENRKLKMNDVLAHPLGPLPWALASGDGSLRKTNKAALARELERNGKECFSCRGDPRDLCYHN